jgi:hypothetical protein
MISDTELREAWAARSYGGGVPFLPPIAMSAKSPFHLAFIDRKPQIIIEI